MEVTQTQISNLVENLASKLGVKAEQLFEVVKAQAKVETILQSLYLIFYIVLVVIGFKAIFWGSMYWQFPFESLTGYQQSVEILAPITGIGSIIIAVISIGSCIRILVTAAANPGYWALYKIFREDHEL